MFIELFWYHFLNNLPINLLKGLFVYKIMHVIHYWWGAWRNLIKTPIFCVSRELVPIKITISEYSPEFQSATHRPLFWQWILPRSQRVFPSEFWSVETPLERSIPRAWLIAQIVVKAQLVTIADTSDTNMVSYTETQLELTHWVSRSN